MEDTIANTTSPQKIQIEVAHRVVPSAGRGTATTDRTSMAELSSTGGVFLPLYDRIGKKVSPPSKCSVLGPSIAHDRNYQHTRTAQQCRD
jgi:hypothetical protein